MFFIKFDSNYKYSKKIEGQFEPFKNERGKLPSFSVCFHNSEEATNIISTLYAQHSVGDYVFYKKTDNGFWISFCDSSYALMDESFTHTDVYLFDKVQNDGTYEASYLTMQAYMYRLVDTGSFMIHSAAVVYENSGIMFCGKSGAGKSTQARLWQKHLRCSIINSDKPCIINESDKIYVHGSPWSGKERIFQNKCVPLKAIVFVVQAKKNCVRKLSSAEAMSHIFLHNYVFPLTQKIEEQYLQAVCTVAEKIPVFELSCDISENAVEIMFNSIFEQLDYNDVKKELVMKYKVKDCFDMRQIAEEFIVIPRGTVALDFKASVVFNESGAFLWENLKDYVDEDTLANLLQKKYNIAEDLAKKDTKIFIEKMLTNNMLDTIEG